MSVCVSKKKHQQMKFYHGILYKSKNNTNLRNPTVDYHNIIVCLGRADGRYYMRNIKMHTQAKCKRSAKIIYK